ncbi:hypothetical protein GCM10022222_35500 [Amycolatopsis ultiminotia]|uniref:Uncharacterized protein n=1 Tax=Amycolatopsis ultiminotia TaxID=543629 RepID=A0ABP6W9T2_9PSEU
MTVIRSGPGPGSVRRNPRTRYGSHPADRAEPGPCGHDADRPDGEIADEDRRRTEHPAIPGIAPAQAGPGRRTRPAGPRAIGHHSEGGEFPGWSRSVPNRLTR